HHDRGGIVGGWSAVNQALVAAGGISTQHADGVQLVHHFRHGQQGGHGAEGFTAKVGVHAGEYHPASAVGEVGGECHDVVVQELRLIHRDHLRPWVLAQG